MKKDKNEFLHIGNRIYLDKDKVESQLLQLLPHGSGINYDWSFDYLKNGKVVCHNKFDSINEVGYYCHNYDFSVKVKYNPITFTPVLDNISFHGIKELSCCGYGIHDYLEELIACCLE